MRHALYRAILPALQRLALGVAFAAGGMPRPAHAALVRSRRADSARAGGRRQATARGAEQPRPARPAGTAGPALERHVA